MRPAITGIAIVALTAVAAAVTSSSAIVKSPLTASMQKKSVASPGALVAQAISTTQPDFSGVWTMDNDRSEAAAQGQPIGLISVAISQTGSILQVETTRDGKKEIATYHMCGNAHGGPLDLLFCDRGQKALRYIPVRAGTNRYLSVHVGT
jgi:hypothetical protein